MHLNAGAAAAYIIVAGAAAAYTTEGPSGHLHAAAKMGSVGQDSNGRTLVMTAGQSRCQWAPVSASSWREWNPLSHQGP